MFSDDFELVVKMKEFNNSNAEESITDVLSDLGNEGIETSNAHTEFTSVGFGADAISLLIVLGGLFFAGKNIEENLDSWIRLGKRLLKAIARLRGRQANVMLSEQMAKALSISYVMDVEANCSSILPLSSATYYVHNASLNPDYRNIFKYNPYCYYVFGWGIDDKLVRIVYLSSNGEILLSHKLSLNYLEFPKLDTFFEGNTR